MSNYPPGVTGNEYEISGPTYEEDEKRTCSDKDCGFSDEVIVQGYESEKWWTCPDCGLEHIEEIEENRE